MLPIINTIDKALSPMVLKQKQVIKLLNNMPHIILCNADETTELSLRVMQQDTPTS